MKLPRGRVLSSSSPAMVGASRHYGPGRSGGRLDRIVRPARALYIGGDLALEPATVSQDLLPHDPVDVENLM